MLIAETLCLVALDPLSGQSRTNLQLLHSQPVLATAVLMELAVQNRIGLRNDVVVLLDNLPSRHPLLTVCLKLISQVSGQLSAAQAIQHTCKILPQLDSDLLEGLVRRDILHPPKGAWLWLRSKNFPVRSIQAQNEAIERTRTAVTGEDTSFSALAVLNLACATRVVDQLFTFDEAESAKARFREMREEIREQLAHETEHLDDFYAVSVLEALALALEHRLNPN